MQDHFHQLHRFYWKLKIEEVLDGPDIDDCEKIMLVSCKVS